LATFKQFCNSLYISHFKKSNLHVRDKRKNLFASDSDTKQGLVPATLAMALSLQVSQLCDQFLRIALELVLPLIEADADYLST
jgi:hypothetical protein